MFWIIVAAVVAVVLLLAGLSDLRRRRKGQVSGVDDAGIRMERRELRTRAASGWRIKR
jgi:hypothetical protein